MSWGRANRMNRIFDPTSGRTVMLAVDHGYFLGPTHGMERPAEALAPLLPYADAVMATRGLLRSGVHPAKVRSVVLRASGGVSVTGPSLEDEELLVSVEDALRVNASALAVSVFVGTDHERQTLSNLSRAIDRAQRFDLPVLAVTAVGKELGAQDLRSMSLATRICAELGADFVKTYYADGFEALVQSAMVPVVIAGGKKLATERDALQLAHDAVGAGAAGVDFGRNVWQSAHPQAMIRALRAVVHRGASVDDAHELYRHLVEGREEVDPGGTERMEEDGRLLDMGARVREGS
jgi:putative autoinducer-2 (AI-2) aldolase